ncbi:hypothetical protein Tco_0997793 [Tanacetum coccineum]
MYSPPSTVLHTQKGITWVKWNNILLDAENEGLGVGSILAKNMGLLGKWKWRFLVEKNALWRTMIKDFYGLDGGFGSPYNSFGVGGNLVFDSDGEDKWVWKGDVFGYLKVKPLSKSLQNLLLANDIIDKHCIWNSWIPKKNYNSRIVNADPTQVDSVMNEDIFPSIQSVSKIWISERFKSHEANWNCWIPRPFDIVSNITETPKRLPFPFGNAVGTATPPKRFFAVSQMSETFPCRFLAVSGFPRSFQAVSFGF